MAEENTEEKIKTQETVKDTSASPAVQETDKKERKAKKKKEEIKEEHTGQSTTEPEEKHEEKPDEKKSPKKRATKKKSKAVVARGKRKESIARATIIPGKGKLRINSSFIDAYSSNKYVKDIIREPLTYVGPEVNTVDISVTVFGGGIMGQAQAARTAIANGLIEYFHDLKLKEKFLQIDRSLIIEDVRRVEPKKYKGPKARARFQKSYR